MDLDNNNCNMQVLITPLYEAKGWMKLIGIVSIIGGAIYALSIIGIVIAWLPIWMGILLNKASNLIEQAYNSDDEYVMSDALKNLKTYFIINGVLVLIAVVFMGFTIAVWGFAAISGVLTGW